MGFGAWSVNMLNDAWVKFELFVILLDAKLIGMALPPAKSLLDDEMKVVEVDCCRNRDMACDDRIICVHDRYLEQIIRGGRWRSHVLIGKVGPDEYPGFSSDTGGDVRVKAPTNILDFRRTQMMMWERKGVFPAGISTG